VDSDHPAKVSCSSGKTHAHCAERNEIQIAADRAGMTADQLRAVVWTAKNPAELIGGAEVAAKALAHSPLFDPLDFQADDATCLRLFSR
jgi:hypothetical protein